MTLFIPIEHLIEKKYPYRLILEILKNKKYPILEEDMKMLKMFNHKP